MFVFDIINKKTISLEDFRIYKGSFFSFIQKAFPGGGTEAEKIHLYIEKFFNIMKNSNISIEEIKSFSLEELAPNKLIKNVETLKNKQLFYSFSQLLDKYIGSGEGLEYLKSNANLIEKFIGALSYNSLINNLNKTLKEMVVKYIRKKIISESKKNIEYSGVVLSDESKKNF